jgi:hypothetical protein
MEIKIDPSCVFPADMTQKELDEMLADFKEMIDNGTLEENSREITDEEYERLVADEEEVTKH